jgi:putative tryptophan/tyrosine transport system substrate-binding protein
VSIRRREFITLLGGATVWPVTARAQQPATPVIGLLYSVSASEWAVPMAGFHRGLSETGYAEGRNVAIEYRWADNQLERLPTLAADLVGRKVSVILVGGTTAALLAVKAATQTIPIIFTTAVDPVAAGLVTSLNRPGGNITGITNLNHELGPKRLEMLHEVIPKAVKVALLVNPNNPAGSEAEIQPTQEAALRIGLEIIVLYAGTENEIEVAFTTAVQQRAAALDIAADAFFNSRRAQIAALALRHTLPTIASDNQAPTAGVLMSYGSNDTDIYRQAGAYVGRVLRGEKPSDLPVVQATKVELVINLKTAKVLGLTIPPSVLAIADEVIE